VTLVIVFIGAICDYYFGAVGAVLGALVVIASLSKSKANVLLPSLLLIGLSWGAGALLADDAGAIVGVIAATALTLCLEKGPKLVIPRHRHSQISSRDNARS
jgi:glucose uptake protein GlcU